MKKKVKTANELLGADAFHSFNLVHPAIVDYGEFGATNFCGELFVGECGSVRPAAEAPFEVLKVLEMEDLATAHEIDDLASSPVDRVHPDEMSFLVDADRVEAIVDVGLHGVECVVRITKRPALVVREDGGDVANL